MMNLRSGCLSLMHSVCELKNPTMSQFLNALDNTGWLQHIRAVLDGAIFIARVGKYRSI